MVIGKITNHPKCQYKGLTLKGIWARISNCRQYFNVGNGNVEALFTNLLTLTEKQLKQQSVWKWMWLLEEHWNRKYGNFRLENVD